MITAANVPNDDEFEGNNPIEPDQDETQRELPSDTNRDNLNDSIQNDGDLNKDSIPSEIVNDDIPDGDALERKLPSDDSNIGDNPIFPDEDDIIPKNDGYPSNIRNNDDQPPSNI